MSQELVSSRDVDECDRVELRMDISFHSEMPSNKYYSGLTLACLKARVSLADYVDATLTTNDLAVRVTVFERFE
jgi:ribosomal protein L21E